MIYRRPRDFDAAIAMLQGIASYKAVSGARQKRLQRAVARLFEIGWFEDAMRPLYDANVVCQIIMHSIVPTMQELVFEQHVYDGFVAKRDPEATATRGAEFDAIAKSMRNAAPLRKQRTVTAEFETMAAAMEAYASCGIIQDALREVFVTMPTARTALRLISERINDALQHHTEIERSSDIPLDALSL